MVAEPSDVQLVATDRQVVEAIGAVRVSARDAAGFPEGRAAGRGGQGTARRGLEQDHCAIERCAGLGGHYRADDRARRHRRIGLDEVLRGEARAPSVQRGCRQRYESATDSSVAASHCRHLLKTIDTNGFCHAPACGSAFHLHSALRTPHSALL